MGKLFLPRHGHTHCPGGSDPISCLGPATFRACNLTHQITVPNLNEQELHWDTWENNNEDVFDTILSSGRVRFTRLHKVGIYSLNCRVRWEGGATPEPDLTSIILSDDYFGADVQTFGQTFDFGTAGYSFSVTRSYPVFQNDDVDEVDTPPFSTILWKVNQAGSVTQETYAVGETSMEIIYLGGSTSFTPTYP